MSEDAPDGWVRIGKYAIQRENWTICKAVCGGVAKYTLWEGDTSRGIFTTADAAKEAAKVTA